MKDTEITPQHFFEKSVSILFFYGQLPVILTTFVLVVLLAICHGAKGNYYVAGVLISAAVALSTSIAAVSIYRKSQFKARLLLYLSMVATLIYLTCLVRITSGSVSPFIHLYLYVPAVVFMVTRRDHKAELICSIGVFLSFLYNHDIAANWEAWKLFHLSGWYGFLEISIIAILLILLSLVNKQIENLVKIENV